MGMHQSIYLIRGGAWGAGPTYCIDLKSYYASVECIARGLNPLEAKLQSQTCLGLSNTICLAVSPALRPLGQGDLDEAAHKQARLLCA